MPASCNTFRHPDPPKAGLAAFAASRLVPAKADEQTSATAGAIIDLLASSALTTQKTWLRRPSISNDGVANLVSLKLSSKQDDVARLLVEPGHLAMTVAQQIAFSLQTLDTALEMLSWRAAADDVNKIVAAVLPANPRSTDNWWGGIWMGAARLDTNPEMRVYLNLRFGTPAERWSRVSTLLSVFAEHQDHAEEVQTWLDNMSGESPVGLAFVIRGARVVGLRLYVSVRYDIRLLRECLTPISTDDRLIAACQDFHREFGEPISERITLGFDFIRKRSGIVLAVDRVKAELCCQQLDAKRQPEILEWIEQRLDVCGLDKSPLPNFLADVDAHWCNRRFDFVSVGVTRESAHVTVYVKPW